MQKIVVSNMKMLLTKEEIDKYVCIIDNKDYNDIDLILCPSNIYISLFNQRNYSLGVQNIHYEQIGSYTGEISPKQIKSMNVKYSIVGHSERRENFNETDEIINKKVKACLEEDIKVILCIGETLFEKDNNKSKEIIKKQIMGALSNININKLNDIIIAYEPVYTIGSGKSINLNDLKENILFIKNLIKELYYSEIKVIYGGSVSEENVKEIIPYCDGVMIGKLSTDVCNLLRIIENINN